MCIYIYIYIYVSSTLCTRTDTHPHTHTYTHTYTHTHTYIHCMHGMAWHGPRCTNTGTRTCIAYDATCDKHESEGCKATDCEPGRLQVRCLVSKQSVSR